ncbi:fibronectin type III domain-containing protein [Candidatus Kaiserbacteria bacterium]|nr:fibronectin type III domain-containing protein [Candidatus Kaiserbacteria bacterium]
MIKKISTTAVEAVAFIALVLGVFGFAALSPWSVVSLIPQKAEAVGPTVIFLTSGTTWTVPVDWNSANNTIEVIGGGGSGATDTAGNGLGGGGGGAYSKSVNVSLTAGASITYAVGDIAGDTYFCNSTSNCASTMDTAVVAGAKGGTTAPQNGTGGSGGAAASGVASGIGSIKNSGGTSANGAGLCNKGGGGGGAGGSTGNGNNGSSSTGGSGDAGAGGAGGGTATAGSPGTEWDASHGSGGGGGGNTGCAGAGATGGLYGAGGGGASLGTGGAGRPGIIVITYTPIPPTTVPTAPQNLDASGGIEQISLTWTASSSDGGSAITNYKIYRGTSPTPITLYQTVGNVLNYTDSAVVTGTTYYYRVKATNAVGDSAYSNEDSTVATASCPTGPNGGNITGWAWSDTIGWISLNSGDSGTCASSVYGLTLAGSSITGYAWSENVGWIQFGGLSGFPAGSGTTASNATVSGSNIVGWARALSYSDSQAGGWDGWISLSGTGYGLTLVNNTQIIGYAWGDTNLGWISFSANYACSGTYGYYCSANVKHYRDVSCGVDTISGVPETCSYLCSSGACVPPPNPIGTLGNGLAIKVTPTLVRPGSTVSVQWGTQDTTACTVTGTNGDSWTGTSGTRTSRVITTATTFTLDCTGGGGTSLHQSAQVRTTPRFKEF